MGLAMKHRIVVAVLLCFTAVTAQNLKTFSETYGPFDSRVYDAFQFTDSATTSEGALQLTPALTQAPFVYVQIPPENQTGRVMLRKRFKLWEQGYKTSESDRVASFNSSFLFNIYPNLINTWGEGLAFVLAPDMSIPSNSSGQYLGLTNFSTDGSPGNRLVAIEFDTVKQDFDPDANHVGLNINGITSTVNASLTPLGIELALARNATNLFNVWVQYDGFDKVIEVYIAPQAEINGETPSRPDTPVLKSPLDLREILDQHSYFGFSASTGSGSSAQRNSVFWWNLTVDSYEDVDALTLAPGPAPALAPEDKHPPWKKILVGVGVPLLVIGAAVTGYYYLCKKRSKAQSKSNVLLGALKILPGTPREFQFKDLKKATNNFDEKKKLGQGGFGVVYRGYLHNENLEVAVKWFSRETINGWCHKKGKLLLVYDYMPNGSLDAHLFTRTPNSKPLSWDQRYNIISGVASALHYLHNEYDQRVVHRDLKASNIMLDSDYNARLGDFGLARALDKEKSSYTEARGVAGTLGYIAPECFLTGKATQQSDVYAFGIVLLEIVCGLRPGAIIDEFDFLVDWVWSLHRENRILDAIEERLGDEYVIEEAQKMLILALACCQPIASERPRTQGIVQIISGLAPVPFVPPFKPAFVWPMPSVDENDISSSTSPTETRSFRMAHSESNFTQQHISRELYANDKIWTV
ncbi:hypothetical protein RHMOL_Rhmol08G0029600 [Rhododendron molle]|uniref:Uncharacterized protein n=1 Tax=Rhododendron molle TaxID=49168 RepID=A0ACC0MK74_RHOML|nr:hypothetical protein RHMOL_Rhmol08G0029600 [Rhododendron molle]